MDCTSQDIYIFWAGTLPAPPLNNPVTNKINEGGNNQNPILLRRGKALSGHTIFIGTSQFN